MAEHLVHVVDDDAAVGDALKALVESSGYAVTVHSSAEAFLADMGPEPGSCLLLDVRMPGMGGLELQRRLKQQGSSLPVILLTGHGDVPMAVTAMKEGAVDFLEKPYGEDALLDALEQAIRRGAEGAAQPTVTRGSIEALERLTPRELEVFQRLAIGASNKVVARDLGLSPRTIEVHRAHVMQKLACRNIAQLVRIAIAAESFS